MPIDHAAHATPITAVDYEAEHVGSSTLIDYDYDPPDETYQAAPGAAYFQATVGWAYFNIGTFADPVWKPLAYVINADASAGFYSAGTGAGATANVFGPIFQIYTGPTPSGMAVLTGTDDPTTGGGIDIGNIYLRQNGDVTEIWCRTGSATTAWTKLT